MQVLQMVSNRSVSRAVHSRRGNRFRRGNIQAHATNILIDTTKLRRNTYFDDKKMIMDIYRSRTSFQIGVWILLLRMTACTRKLGCGHVIIKAEIR